MIDSIQGTLNLAGGTRRVGAPRPLDEQRSFGAILARAQDGSRRPDQARQAAEQLVATALVQPILKQLRETNGAAEPFKPGPGEQAFQQLMDTHLAEKLVHSSRWALVDEITKRLTVGAGATP